MTEEERQFYQEIRQYRMTMRGPLPDPGTLQGFEHVVEGAASRIIRQAELEQAHRHEMDRLVLTQHWAAVRRGQIFGALLGVSCVAAGLGLGVWAAAPSAGALLGGAGAGSLVLAYMYGRSKDDSAVDEDGPAVSGDEPGEPEQTSLFDETPKLG